MSEFTRDYPPQILASPHQLDLAPYASGSYNTQRNALELLHDKHMLHSSCILRKMEVEEPWLGLWPPLNYRVDMGVSQHTTPELGEFYKLLFWKIPSSIGVLVCVKVGVWY